MTYDRRREALAAWYEMLDHPAIRMDVEEQYDELLKAADEMEHAELISSSEWRSLVRKAGVAFSHSTEGMRGGT
ncbi:hypothetical protein [Pseudomonas sp. MYb118]|uniref:hypothetical protein n=1 Tax=Pseudomonas sp. MYb118 TaxID=1848720 RepID=UPI0034CF8554